MHLLHFIWRGILGISFQTGALCSNLSQFRGHLHGKPDSLINSFPRRGSNVHHKGQTLSHSFWSANHSSRHGLSLYNINGETRWVRNSFSDSLIAHNWVNKPRAMIRNGLQRKLGERLLYWQLIIDQSYESDGGCKDWNSASVISAKSPLRLRWLTHRAKVIFLHLWELNSQWVHQSVTTCELSSRPSTGF